MTKIQKDNMTKTQYQKKTNKTKIQKDKKTE